MKKIQLLPGYDSIIKLEEDLKVKQEEYWFKRGERATLELFHKAAQKVPAYKDFLKKNRINHEKIKTLSDLKLVPPTSKEGYLKKYSRKDLCWDKEFSGRTWTISTTSGSTGEPFYFPRSEEQVLQYALSAELYLRQNFEIHKKSTLYIVGFPMGAWIGGLFTHQALERVAARGNYKLSIITPGINKSEIIKIVKDLGKEFDQIIIGSYSPFLKDIIDEGIAAGFNWGSYNIGLIFSAEGFSEEFRDYVVRKMELKNPLTATLNHYGTVDLGTMSHETPLSIMLRRMAVKNGVLFKSLFGEINRLPTFTQFLPEQFFFEEEKGNLFCSSSSGYPLLRYDLRDRGGVLRMKRVSEIFQEQGIEIREESKKAGIANTVGNLPFVHVYERNDLSVSFFAFQIYPETVRKVLQSPSFENFLTGKFTMSVKFNNQGNQYLEINSELKPKIKGTKPLEKKVENLVMERLIKENSEYRKTSEIYPKRVVPKIVFWPYEHELHFKPGIKQKWVG